MTRVIKRTENLAISFNFGRGDGLFSFYIVLVGSHQAIRNWLKFKLSFPPEDRPKNTYSLTDSQEAKVFATENLQESCRERARQEMMKQVYTEFEECLEELRAEVPNTNSGGV